MLRANDAHWGAGIEIFNVRVIIEITMNLFSADQELLGGHFLRHETSIQIRRPHCHSLKVFGSSLPTNQSEWRD
jgi:hypothetical protein